MAEEKQIGKTFSIASFEQATTKETMNSLLDQGKQLMDALFNYKSVIPGLVQVKGDAENKKELYKKNLELLEPQVQKMRDLSNYYETLVNSLVGYVNNIISQKQLAPHPEEVSLLAQVLDAVLILDYLKTWQPGLNNDFSMYRRAIQHVKKDYNSSEDEQLRVFLINPNNINKGVKKALQDKCKGFEKIFMFVVKHCADEFEKDNKKIENVRIAVFTIILIDTIFVDKETVAPLKKQVKLAKLLKVFKDNPRVTLYQNLPFNVAAILKGAPNYSENIEAYAVESKPCNIL